MSALALSGIIFIALLAALIFVAKGGPRVRVYRFADSKPPPENLVQHAPQVLKALGMRVQSTNTRADGVTEISAIRTHLDTGQKISLRILPNDADVVGVEQVRAAATALKSEGFDKIVLVSPSGFSSDARALARGTPIELMTAIRWVELDAVLARTVARPQRTLVRHEPLLS